MVKFGLIGNPIGHSVSPRVFAEAYGGCWPYDLIEGADFEASWQKFLGEYQAINITTPFKEPAFRKVAAEGALGGCGFGDNSEEITADAIRALGAINIAVKETDGLVHGYNSDYLGVLKLLRNRGFGPGSTVVVAGFGGAGKAAAAAARAAGCDVVVCNRSRYNPEIRPLEELSVLCAVADLLIYTLAVPIPELKEISSGQGGAHGPAAILEANYRTPCLAPNCLKECASVSGKGTLPYKYIPGTEWHRAQAETGYPLMTGCPTLPF